MAGPTSQLSFAHWPVAQLTVEPIFGWWILMVLAAITLASVWLTITAEGLAKRSRATLVALRLAATLVLLLGWLRPAYWTSVDRETEGAIAVLMDQSQSMTLPSDSLGKSRWSVQQEVWGSLVDQTNMKVGGSSLVPYFFDKDVVASDERDLPQLKTGFSKSPEGRATDLGRALAEVGRLQTNPPLRAVVMMGDAAQNVVPPQSDPMLVAKQMSQLNQPILFVGIGATGEASLLRDVAIEAMPEEITAFAKKEVGVPIIVSAQGLQNQPIEVNLTLKSRQGPDRVVMTRKILPLRPSEKIPLELRLQLDEPGDYLLEAKATTDTTEQISSNNEAISFVTVRDGGVRILLLEGQPRYEQLYLKSSLDASYEFDLNYVWLPSRTRGSWPIDISRNVELDQFDVYVVGDLDSSALSSANWQKIASAVSQGAGLLLLGGYQSFDAGGYQNSPLADVIPIRMVRQRQPIGEKIDDRFHVQQPVQLIPTRPHPITSLLPEPENTRLWQSLKPMEGMNRFRGVSNAPGTQILLSGPQQEPVLVAGQFGKGRVLAFAADSTWQWYMAGEESGQKKAHQTFWRQAILWLVNREKLQEGFRLLIDSRRQDIDATPKIKVEWFGGSENRPFPSNLKLALSRDGQFLKNLDTTTLGQNEREAVAIGLDQAGLYRAQLVATQDDGQEYTSELAFLVQDYSKELVTSAADWQMMQNLVAAGQVAGSELFLPEETQRLVDRLREMQDQSKITMVQRRRLGDAAWDSWIYLLLFCGLMTAEWGLRKRWQMP